MFRGAPHKRYEFFKTLPRTSRMKKQRPQKAAKKKTAGFRRRIQEGNRYQIVKG